MRLAIDLRFYRPEPYGLAVHIRDLLSKLIPMLEASEVIEEVVLILDQRIKSEPLDKYLDWWKKVEQSKKIKPYFSTSKYYTFREQTGFLRELYDLKLDLVYFFTFNFPVLYTKPYLYQVLDLSIPKTRSQLSIKVQAMLLCFRVGVRNAKQILFLGKNTRKDAEHFSGMNFTDKNSSDYKSNTIIYNGINPIYLTTDSADSKKAEIANLTFSKQKESELKDMKKTYGISKPYFFFVSVWRKYKNIERLAQAFDRFNRENGGKYQLVLGGGQDHKYPEILQNITQLEQYKQKNIIITGRIEKDSDVIALYDGAQALVAPSLSEGFGLWMVEAASRGVPVIASDIDIFHEIAAEDIIYFDPTSVSDIQNKLAEFTTLTSTQKKEMVKKLIINTKKFRWEVTAKTIIDTIESTYEQV